MTFTVRRLLQAGFVLVMNSAFCMGQNLLATLKVPNHVVSVGDPIRVDVTLKNVSKEDIRIKRIPDDGQADLSFTFALLRDDGATVQETELRKLHKSGRMVIISRSTKTLQLGDAISEWADISKLFVLSPGTYKITVSRESSGFETFGKIISQPVEITVVP